MQRIQWLELVAILSDYILVEKCETLVSDSLLYLLVWRVSLSIVFRLWLACNECFIVTILIFAASSCIEVLDGVWARTWQKFWLKWRVFRGARQWLWFKVARIGPTATTWNNLFVRLFHQFEIVSRLFLVQLDIAFLVLFANFLLEGSFWQKVFDRFGCSHRIESLQRFNSALYLYLNLFFAF